MKLERLNTSSFRITMHAYELAALVSAARWVVNGAEGEIPDEAKQQLSQILAAYDAETKQLSEQDETP